MQPSRRIQQVPASPTIGITAKAKQMKADGIDVVSFGAGEPDFDTPQFIKDACIAALQAGDTKYVPRQGAALKKVIAEKLSAENGIEVDPVQVLMTFGGKHAFYAAFQCMLDPGEKVLIPAPYWVSYPAQASLAGGDAVILSAGPESHFKISPQQILDHADDAKILVLNSPSNPTGVMYSRAELQAIAEAVLQTDLAVFSDEIYEKLIYGDEPFVSFATLDPRLPERTLTFNGLSKTFAMTGWRLGWVTGPKEIIAAMGRLLSQETTNPVSFAQAGALAAYTDPQGADVIAEMRQTFAKRGQHMCKRLNELPGVTCVKPDGAFYCFPDVSANFGRTLTGIEVTDSMRFAKAALDGVKVALVPGSAFGEDRCVRLSFAASDEQIDKGIDRLAELLT
ncbi:MAG: aminotransferase class I/II-fold pyridoxal phosphate-dependent enzyme [Planctomycetes bacterium]|jgi:aspartate aminotransferase|nr:pyridoxal phosphate-dependent aminotransferase [Phycisphaerae bacterium]NBB95235.1 aminotransferase class I/II-fold pyridoxal phosphate-dependent enzyme [Planctomycetota bacterium]